MISIARVLPQRTLPGARSGRTDAAVAFARAFARSPEGWSTIGALVFLAVYAVWLLSGATPGNRVLAADLWNLPLVFGAAVAAWFTSRARGIEPRLRRAWRLSALAFLCYTVGNVWWFVDQNVLGELPLVSWSDVIYLSYYPLLFAGLLSFPSRPRTRQEALRLGLDIATVMLAGGVAIWYLVLGPTFNQDATTPFETAVTAAYPIGDLVLLFGSALALLHRPATSGRLALTWLGIGGLLVFGTDMVYGRIVLRDGEYLSGHPADLGWQVASFFWFGSAQLQRFSIGRESLLKDHQLPRYHGVSLLPYVALFAGFVMLVDVARPVWSLSLGVVIATLGVLAGIVVIRQVLAVSENAQLVHERTVREARFSSMVQHSSDVISIIDRRGTLVFVSPAVGRVLHWHADGLVGQNISTLIHPEDLASARIFLRNMAEHPGGTASLVCRFRDGDGSWRHVESMCTSLLDDPTVGGLVLNTRDVSERSRLEAELTRRALNDPLTGLANRVHFQSMTERGLERHSSHLSVLFLDLDNFKTINDSLGHQSGDQLLVEVAGRLLSATRGCDTVARLGGDEFAVLLDTHATDNDAIAVAERISRAMEQPFRLGASEVVVGASIGIAHSHAGVRAEELLRDADVAMYVAKREGKRRYMVFRPEMQHAVRDHQQLEADLRLALERNEFRLVFQPVVNMKTGVVAGTECLLRWEHPQRGLLLPDSFIDPATESGLIIPIGRWVLRSACQQLAEWRRQCPALSQLAMAVNVAGRQLQADGFVADVADVLQSTGIPPARLILEITEGEIMQRTDVTLARLHALKALGVRVAIDDFGTGYSSLSYLQRFPVDILKVDKSFIDQVTSDGHGNALTRTIVTLAHTLDLKTVAEGIQEEEQLEVLAEMGCDYGQGYLYSPPLAAQAFVEFVADGATSWLAFAATPCSVATVAGGFREVQA